MKKKKPVDDDVDLEDMLYGTSEPQAAPANDNTTLTPPVGAERGNVARAKDCSIFKPYTWGEIEAMADAPWCIGSEDQPILIGDGLWCNFGLYKHGKTYLSFAEAFAISFGLPFNGMDVTQGKVAYLIAEGGMSRMRKRFAALYTQHEDEMKKRGFKSAAMAFDSRQFDMIGSAVNLVDFNAKNGMGVDDLVRELGGGNKQYAATFLDTWALMLAAAGGHDSDAETVMPAINGCKRIQKVIGGTVVLVAHVGLSATAQDRPKGLSDLPGAVDGGTLAQKTLGKSGEEIFTFTSAMQRHAANGYSLTARLVKHHPNLALEFMKASDKAISKLTPDQHAAYNLAVECGEGAPVEAWRAKCAEAGLWPTIEGATDPARAWRNQWAKCKLALQVADLVSVENDTIQIKDLTP